MSKTIDRYFELVDIAGKDKKQLDALVDLFTDDGTITPAEGDAASGKGAIREYLISFYTNVSNESRHFYNITAESGHNIEVDWAVAAKLKQGGLFTLQGHNMFEISDDGKIQNLKVYNAK